MIKLYTCIQSEHYLPIVALAGLICLFGSLIATDLFDRCLRSRNSRFDWLVISGLVGGTTIWSTHFIAMLAYSQQLATTFEAATTILSLLSAIVTTMLGIAIARYGRRFGGPEIGGAVIGLGGCLMHFIGMKAYEPAGLVYFDEDFARASVVIGGLVGSLAMSTLVRSASPNAKRFAAMLLVLCIVGLHFVAMSGVTIVPYGASAAAGLTRDTLAVGVFAIGCLVIGVGFFANSIDRRNRLRASHDVSFASHHDPLTGLPNRLCFEETMEGILEAARRKGRQVAVCKINVVSMHEINEVLGGGGGDEVLVEVSRRLKAVVGSAGFLARLSGTRFAAVAECDDVLQAHAISQSIFESLTSPVQIRNRTLNIRFRMGAAMFPRDGASQGLLMANANVALERARGLPGNGICFYDEATGQQTHRRRLLSQEMQRALELGQLELYFQPQFDVASLEISGFEGLLRWHHPQFGFVSPSEFIPIAEQTGLIVPIGQWVLREGCRLAASWHEPVKVALNLSPVQLKSPDIGAAVIDAVKSSGLAFERLELEITESTLIDSPEETLKELQSLQTLGISIALDDFGSGYSSLGTLSSFAFNKIKLDKSFLHGTRPTAQAAAIIAALLTIGRKLGMKVLAEGVETEEQLEFLREEGCDCGQGYLIGKPIPARDIDKWVSEFAARPQPRKAPVALLRVVG
jgi:diguanylate cyclase (GGDEF)-like protein